MIIIIYHHNWKLNLRDWIKINANKRKRKKEKRNDEEKMHGIWKACTMVVVFFPGCKMRSRTTQLCIYTCIIYSTNIVIIMYSMLPLWMREMKSSPWISVNDGSGTARSLLLLLLSRHRLAQRIITAHHMIIMLLHCILYIFLLCNWICVMTCIVPYNNNKIP